MVPGAVEIARRNGYVIGEMVAERYLQAREEATFGPPRGHSREVAGALANIAGGIADLANGKTSRTTLHNISAWMRQLVDLAGTAPEIAHAADGLIRACGDLDAGHQACGGALEGGSYPELAERAKERLRKLAALIGRSPRPIR